MTQAHENKYARITYIVRVKHTEAYMGDTILTLHPEGKSGVNISRVKYDIVYAAIVETLKTHGELTFTDLNTRIEQQLGDSFDGSVSWYVISVKLDLEARGMIERVPNTRPQRVRLTGSYRWGG